MTKDEIRQSFLSLQDFDAYMERFPEFIGLPVEGEVFRKEMELMGTDGVYTHRRKDQLRQQRKREIIKSLHAEIDHLCGEIEQAGPYTDPDEADTAPVNIVYLYPKGKREDINHAVALKTAAAIDTDGDICYAAFPPAAIREIDLVLYPVKNVFSGYDFLNLEEDAAAAFLLKHSRIFQIEYLMWKINYLTSEYKSLRSIRNTKLRTILKVHQAAVMAERDAIYEQLIAEGETHAKWVSEQKAYAIVKAKYPDAKFQYQPDWLNGQRIDIYIPSEKTAIEYQGKQHTEAVEFFGGMEGLKSNIERDHRKEFHCRANGVKLICWNYDQPLTKAFFEEQIEPGIRNEDVPDPSEK